MFIGLPDGQPVFFSGIAFVIKKILNCSGKSRWSLERARGEVTPKEKREIVSPKGSRGYPGAFLKEKKRQPQYGKT